MTFPDIIGISGVTLILITYFALQIEKMDPKGLLYSLMNLIGSSMILYSLFYTWNTASFIIEIFWIAISLFGLIKFIFRNKRLKSS
jgi:hypothetical protein